MSNRLSLGIICRICLKSSPKTTTFPQNGESALEEKFMMSLRLLSSASMQNLCVIGSSSQIMSFSPLIAQQVHYLDEYYMLSFAM